MAKRIEINCITGERVEVELSPEELAAAEAATAAELAAKAAMREPTKAEIVAELAALTAKVNALK